MAHPLQDRTRYDPGESEARVFARWFESGRFHPEPAGTAAENYSIAIPPPNVTGALHMGHALNGTIQDTLIRYARMRGKRTKWILGTDHAGIATQTQVERLLASEGTSREEIGREAFVERVWRWREQYGGTIIDQYKRLGASCDYAEERFTLDEAYVRGGPEGLRRAVREGPDLPRQLHGQLGPGLAVGDLRPRGRGPRGHGHPLLRRLPAGVAATGRSPSPPCGPETMLGDTAIAVHPDDDRYTRLVGETAILPIVGRKLRIIADDYVKPEFGTGALKITPGHDPNDFEIGRKHGLDELTVIGEDGRMTEAAGERFAGLPALEAREAVVAALREEGRINRTEPYTHEVPVLAALRRADRAADLAAVVHEDGGAGRARARRGRRGPRPDPPRGPAPALPALAGEHPPVVHLAPAVVGPPAAGLLPRRRDLRRHGPAGRPRLGARPGRPGHVVLERAVAVRDARLAGRHRGAEGVLSHRRPARRRATSSSCGSPVWSSWGSSSRATSRSTTSTCTRSSRRPTGAGCRSRSAPGSTRWR